MLVLLSGSPTSAKGSHDIVGLLRDWLDPAGTSQSLIPLRYVIRIDVLLLYFMDPRSIGAPTSGLAPRPGHFSFICFFGLSGSALLPS